MIELRRLVKDRNGTAAAEMALISPLLMIILFGTMELGNYFLNEHAVVKAVRDGARYAGRLPVSNYSCPSGNATGTIVGGETEIKNLTRTGSIDGSATSRLTYWTSNSTITVSVRCVPKASYGLTFSPLLGDIPVVKVSAVVPYGASSLFQNLGLATVSLNLNAESESAVMGI